MAPPVLYLHPYNHPNFEVIPAGAIAAVNTLRGPVLGRYAHEVTADELTAARVVLLDVHWFFPLAILDDLLGAIRRARPEVPIVVGGITAAFYGDAFLRRFGVDYLLTGDVEASLPPLVASLLDGHTPPPLPGVATQGHPGAPAQRLSPAEFDGLDWLTIDWFPTLQRQVAKRHAAAKSYPPFPSSPHYPVLMATRGCVRRCSYCHGGYHDRVFGAGLLARSPEGLRRDLLRLSEDPALRYVTIYFGDASSVEHYAPAFSDVSLDLDGFLFFCGVASCEALDTIRSGFAGRAAYSIIQPADLAKTPQTPAGPCLENAAPGNFHRMLAHLARREDPVAIYHVGAPDAGAADMARSATNLSLVTAQDWEIRRPDAARLDADGGPAAQLEGLVEASRSLACAQLLVALVPALLNRGWPEHIELTNLERKAARTDDPFLQRALGLLAAQVTERGLFGFDELRLGWAVGDLPEPTAAGWATVIEQRSGDCTWRGDLPGLCWEGELTLEAGEAPALAPLPVVWAQGESLALHQWPLTTLPALRVASGPRRRVKLGGRQQGNGLTLWIEDGPERVEHFVPSVDRGPCSPPPPAAERHKAEPRKAEPRGDRSWLDDNDLVGWPGPAHRRALLERLEDREGWDPGAGWRLATVLPEDSHIRVRLQRPPDQPLELAVLPRQPGRRFISTHHYCVAYPNQRAEAFEEVRPALLQLLESIERAIP